MNIRVRFTYANVMSTIALLIAMSTGGAYAAGLITTADIADGAVTTPKLRDAAVKTAKIADGAVKRAAIAKGAVNTGQIAVDAVTGTSVRNGALTGVDIKNGSIAAGDLGAGAVRPSAYAHVRFDGVLVDASARGITDAMITRQDTGLYCIDGLSFDPVALSLSGSLAFTGPAELRAGLGPMLDCPFTTQVTVWSTTPAMDPVDASFFINLWAE